MKLLTITTALLSLVVLPAVAKPVNASDIPSCTVCVLSLTYSKSGVWWESRYHVYFQPSRRSTVQSSMMAVCVVKRLGCPRLWLRVFYRPAPWQIQWVSLNSQYVVVKFQRKLTVDISLAMSRLQATMCDMPPESRQRILTIVNFTALPLETLFISLRLGTRWMVQRTMCADDWLMLTVLVSKYLWVCPYKIHTYTMTCLQAPCIVGTAMVAFSKSIRASKSHDSRSVRLMLTMSTYSYQQGIRITSLAGWSWRDTLSTERT